MGFDFGTGKDIAIAVRKIPKDLPDFLFNTMRDLQTFFLAAVFINAPKRSGNYATSWQIGPIKFIPESKSISGTIVTDEGLLYIILEFQGRAPGKIEGNPILHFFAEDGTEVFTRSVDHPGFPPMPHVRPALEETLQNTQRIVNQNLRKNYEIFG